MKKYLFLFILFILPFSAKADSVFVPVVCWTTNYSASSSCYQSAYVAVHAVHSERWPTTQLTSVTETSWRVSNYLNQTITHINARINSHCPAPYVLHNKVCGYWDDEQEKTCNQKASTNYESVELSGRYSVPSSLCDNGCTVTQGISVSYVDSKKGWVTGIGGTYSGGKCDGSEGEPIPDIDENAPKCESGTVPATANGTNYCAKPEDTNNAICGKGQNFGVINGEEKCIADDGSSTDVPAQDAEKSCPAGTTEGNVNGKRICAPNSDIKNQQCPPNHDYGTVNGKGLCVEKGTGNVTSPGGSGGGSQVANDEKNQLCGGPGQLPCRVEVVNGDSEGEGGASSSWGDMPSFYDSKYPDGAAGIWEKSKESLSNGPLIGFIDRIMPTGITAGQCPRFQLDLSIGGRFNYGTFDIDVPCYIWEFLGYLCICFALVAARSIIFGG